MKTLKLYFIALLLITVVNFVNRRLIKQKNGTLDGYDRSEAFALDVFAAYNYRTFWKRYLTDGSPGAYWPKEYGETVSSALGENILRGTQSKPGRTGRIASWFHGEMLSRILNRAFKEPAHCIDARRAYVQKKYTDKP